MLGKKPLHILLTKYNHSLLPPFSTVESTETNKKPRCDVVTEGNDDSLFELLAKSESQPVVKSTKSTTILLDDNESTDSAYSQSMKSFRMHKQEESEMEQLEVTPEDVLQFLPMDWSIKSKLRILSTTPIVSGNLKTNQTASGLSCFVRGIDMDSSTTSLDSSLGAQIHQGTFYWQHPHIPWMTLYPRWESHLIPFYHLNSSLVHYLHF